jgi:succinate dehydrogenase / fumarate reductase cytochrome b subunit
MKPSIRPKFINLLQIRMPPTALVSIGHRVSGLLLVISIPFWIYLFGLSVSGEAGFAQSVELLHSPLMLVFGLIFAWSIGHHLLAGIRFLLLDLDVGMTKELANQTALLVMAGGLILMLVLIGLWP